MNFWRYPGGKKRKRSSFLITRLRRRGLYVRFLLTAKRRIQLNACTLKCSFFHLFPNVFRILSNPEVAPGFLDPAVSVLQPLHCAHMWVGYEMISSNRGIPELCPREAMAAYKFQPLFPHLGRLCVVAFRLKSTKTGSLIVEELFSSVINFAETILSMSTLKFRLIHARYSVKSFVRVRKFSKYCGTNLMNYG